MCTRWCAGGAGICRARSPHFGVEMHERTVGKLLGRLNFSRVSVRPRHPEQDIAAQEAHEKLRRAGRRGPSRACSGGPVELWSQDEHVGQQGSLTYVWADKGSRPACAARSTLRLGLSVRRLLSGARHRRRAGAPCVNIKAMNLRLAESAPRSPRRARRPHPRGAGWYRPGGKRHAGEHQPAALAGLLTRTEPGRVSGRICSRTISPIGSSTPTPPSSTLLATPGRPSLQDPPRSPRSPHATGQKRSTHRRSVLIVVTQRNRMRFMGPDLLG